MSRRVVRFPRPILDPTATGWVARFEPLGLEATGETSKEAEQAIVDLIGLRLGEMGPEDIKAFELVCGEELEPIDDDACVLDVVERLDRS